MRIAFHTLGCKVNQFDTAAMKEQAIHACHDIVSYEEESDVYVINTCSVTEKSDGQSRLLVRKALRTNPNARIVVTGCYAQTHPEELLKIKGVDLVLGTQERGDWLNYLGGCEKAANPLLAVNPVFLKGPLDQPLIQRFFGRTRAFIKVQDGCDARCSFCLIPRARGPSRTVPIEHVIEQIRWLVENDCQETVLTGVNLGFYGRDIQPKLSLAQLILRILNETDLPRLRISSVEPKTVTPELVKALASSTRICRHLHIPLQSGDDHILRRMNRHYSTSSYRKIVLVLHERIPDVCIGTDVMVGFPGEGEKQFQNTYQLLSDLPLGYFHVFPYSPRPKTPAASMKWQVNHSIKSERSRQLRTLSIQKRTAFHKTFDGQLLDVLVEEERDPDGGHLKGYTDNYIKVLLAGPDRLTNRIVPTILHSMDSDVWGSCVEG